MIDTVRRAEPANHHAEAVQARRAEVERILALAEHLDASDRLLLRNLFERGMTATELARTAGLHPETVRRRCRRLLRRMAEPMFRFVLERGRTWPAARRAVAEQIYLRGAGQRATAAALGVTVHEVRRHAEYVRHAFELASTEQRERCA